MEDLTEVSALLLDWRAGDENALERLVPLVYDELHRIADRHLRMERRDHTLQPTALIHEAYLRLVGSDVAWEGRAHFLSVASGIMRRILVDHARARARAKRGGGQRQVTLNEEFVLAPERGDEVIALDEALDRLSLLDDRKARAVELHFFGGLTYDETAQVLAISPATVDRDLRLAKAWLHNELNRT